MSIDYELYDRQIRTFGIDASLKINSSSISIIGLEKGLGTEIAKNLALCGIKNLYFYDNMSINETDLITGYYYSINDINFMRCDILEKKIKELNTQVNIICNDIDNLKYSNVIICINQSTEYIIELNNLYRKNNVKFISLKSSDNKGILFVDANDTHIVTNITGENYEPIQVLSCDKEFNFMTNGHNFQSGDTIKFSNLQGINIDILNNEFTITTNNYKSFKLNTNFSIPENFNFINGTVNYIDKQIIINHQDYKTQIINPTINFLSDKDLIKNYTHSDIEIISVNSIMGSLSASEAIKLVSGIYQPITQWFTWYDSDLNYKLVENKLKDSEFFIVGSGSIGCELLKNLAFLNVKKITITDSDIIEKSNLSNQFLFRTSDIGKLKSKIASKVIKQMKPTLEINYLTEKVGYNNINVTDKILNMKDLTAVFNALDNIDTRRFMDSECFNYNIPLFESGTMGIKGHTQPIIPFLTETYSNSNDPYTEKSFAACTIKNFPNEIQHTIQWALEKFEFFNRAPINMNIWLKNKDIIFEDTTEGNLMNYDVQLFTTKYENKFESYVIWAIDMFYEFFNDPIIQLLNNFPPDTLTIDGNLFWSSGKRCPKPIELDIKNSLHMDFIIATIAILSNITNNNFTLNKDLIIDIINKQNKIINKQNKIINKHNCISQVFKQNDDKNYYNMWINCVSNIRALNYSIEPVNFYTIIGIINKIIPIIPTTISIITGLITIEMIKYLNNNKNFKSTFINLALNIFISAEPLQPKILKIADQEFNSWFKFIEKEDLTLENFINKYNKLFKTNINIISLNSSLIYADFMGSDNSKKFSELIEDYNIDNKKKKYILTLSCDDTYDLPDIVLFI